LTVFDDDLVVGPQTVSLSLDLPTSSRRRVGTSDECTVYYPGWERKIVAGGEIWAQTDPDDLFGPSSSAAVIIEDDDLPVSLLATITASGLLQLEMTGPLGQTQVLESSFDLNAWTPVRTNILDDGRWMIPDLPLDGANRFYLGVRFGH